MHYQHHMEPCGDFKVSLVSRIADREINPLCRTQLDLTKCDDKKGDKKRCMLSHKTDGDNYSVVVAVHLFHSLFIGELL